jgi:ribosomal protein S18 acetylase RimI-like enzyme
MEYQLQAPILENLIEVIKLETESYPPDEAASGETIKLRQQTASKYFTLITEIGSDILLGFINGTCIIGNKITHESMTDHVPEGTTLVIHSVTISPISRRKGLGTIMLEKYIRYIAEECPEIDRILLLSKGHLLGFYVSCGFLLVGLSPVEHGQVNKYYQFVCICYHS